MNNERAIAAGICAALVLLIALMLNSLRLTFDSTAVPDPPRPTTGLLEEPEEFVDFLPEPVKATPAPAQAPEPVRSESKPAEASGGMVATTDRGVKVDDAEADSRRVRDAARSGIANAFAKAEEKTDNTLAHGPKPGDTGTPDGQPSAADGSGHGTVGGGWIMPSYAKVASRATGSIELRAVVDAHGDVISVELTGGKAPASADPALVRACMAEVKKRKFTRTDDKAPETSIARIIYRFK